MPLAEVVNPLVVSCARWRLVVHGPMACSWKSVFCFVRTHQDTERQWRVSVSEPHAHAGIDLVRGVADLKANDKRGGCVMLMLESESWLSLS